MNRSTRIIFAAVALASIVGFAIWRKDVDALSANVDSAPPPMQKVEPLDVNVQAVLALAGFNSRYSNLKKIGPTLAKVDRESLLYALVAPRPPDLDDNQWHALANDLMQVLRSQHEPSPELTDALITLYRDTSAHPTLRDYALQHLREWIADGDTRTTHETRPEKRRAIAQCLWDAAQDSSSASAGTALLAWEEWTNVSAEASIAIEREVISRQEFHNRAARMARGDDGRAFRGAQATALQVCARLGLKEILPVARQLAFDSATDTSLRLSAIAAVGQIGSGEDLSALQAIQPRPPLLNRAIEAAERRLAAK